MIKVPLTQGKFALIDDEDFDLVNSFKWYACKYKNTFYALTNVKLGNKQTTISMHRFILNSKPNEHTDHKNHNTLDNQKHNIRKCTNSQNHMNRKSHRESSSKFKGVCWHKIHKRWIAQIRLRGKLIFLGYSKNEIEAAGAYDKKAKELFRGFALLNLNQNQ